MNTVIFSNPIERLRAMGWLGLCGLMLMLEVLGGPQRALGQQVSTFVHVEHPVFCPRSVCQLVRLHMIGCDHGLAALGGCTDS
jgi:hypothetical protein